MTLGELNDSINRVNLAAKMIELYFGTVEPHPDCMDKAVSDLRMVGRRLLATAQAHVEDKVAQSE